MEKFDIAIVGSGPGGYVAALYAARSGCKVALIEKGLPGGTCLNRGCIPTKVYLESARVLGEIAGAGLFGIETAAPRIDLQKLLARKNETVARLRQGVETLISARSIAFINGTATFVSSTLLDVAGRRIEAGKIIIATGSAPQQIASVPFDHLKIISSDDALELREIPQRLLVVGGGAIGCEFASIYHSFGSRVSIVEAAQEILPGVDREIAKKAALGFKRRGISIFSGTTLVRTADAGSSIEAEFLNGERLIVDKILVSIGRRPVIDGLALENAGVRIENGSIIVDEHMRTSVENIYAIGDVTGRHQFAHVASYEALIAVDHCRGRDARADYAAVPYCVYADPEIAGVGVTEERAKELKLDYKVARFPFSALGKAHIAGKTDGTLKLIGERSTGRLLGVHIIGAQATAMIAEAVVAIKNKMTVESLSRTIHAHPTFPEALLEAAHIFNDAGIHVL
ncbi:MAG: dihydrolipoyl dehydrogenase [Candidatus Omnitrophota bacterium]